MTNYKSRRKIAVASLSSFLEGRLSCVAGVGGGPLGARITAILRRTPAALTPVQGLALLTCAAVLGLTVTWLSAQTPSLSFEVASIRPASPDTRPTKSSMMLMPYEEGMQPQSSLFNVTDYLLDYFVFAYSLPDSDYVDHQSLPKNLRGKYTINARAASTPTRAQLRLMMQSLFKDRFHLDFHYENRSMVVYAIELVHPGKLGPGLQPHSAGRPCGNQPGNHSDSSGGLCQPAGAGEDHQIHMAAQDNTIEQLGSVLGNGVFYQHPLIDRTGLKGHFDMSMHYAMERPNPNDGDSIQPNYQQALNQQLGLRLVLTKATVPVMVIEHIENPAEN